MIRRSRAARAALVCFALASVLSPPVAMAAVEPADLVVVNARIRTATGRPSRPTAMAIRGGQIVAIGNDAHVRPFRGPRTEVLDVWGKALFPGFIDSHGHLSNLGERLVNVDLVGTTSYSAVIDSVRARAARTPAGTWVEGRGWDQNDWAEKELPHHRALSDAVPDHPVALRRVDGHALLVNRAALERARITRDTPNPAGGEILRDASGEATGVLVDGAMALVRRVIPAPTPEERVARLRAAMRECARLGLTMVHDAGIDRATLAAYRTLMDEAPLPIRVHAMAYASSDLLPDVLARGPERGDRFQLAAIKVVLDGALGSRGALLSAPYTDRPSHVGLLTFPLDTLQQVCEMALARGLQMRVHAIGDSANHLALDAYERAFGGRGKPEARWAIEHAQIVQPRDIARFAKLGVVASMQGTHCTSDAPWVDARLGAARGAWCYAWRSMLDARVRVVNGSDFPVESANPMYGIYASLTRRDLNGELPEAGWHSEQRMNRDEALLSFTRWGAWLASREKDLGTLEVGKRADFVVLDRDILTCRYDQIPATRVLRTVVDGKTVYEAPEFMDSPLGRSSR
jgi:predicted amidohydrolase YtcJ